MSKPMCTNGQCIPGQCLRRATDDMQKDAVALVRASVNKIAGCMVYEG